MMAMIGPLLPEVVLALTEKQVAATVGVAGGRLSLVQQDASVSLAGQALCHPRPRANSKYIGDKIRLSTELGSSLELPYIGNR
jgi:hypothetical protein